MISYMIKIKRYLFLYLLLSIIFLNLIKSSTEATRLKIGLKNKIIYLLGNQTIYEIKTNYLHLKFDLYNFDNVKEIQIVDKIMADSPTVKKCAYSSKFCQSK